MHVRKLYYTCVFSPKKGEETGPDPNGAESQTRIREKNDLNEFILEIL
jgi:hypothetical protein